MGRCCRDGKQLRPSCPITLNLDLSDQCFLDVLDHQPDTEQTLTNVLNNFSTSTSDRHECAVAVPLAEVVNWPVAPVVRPAAPEPIWSGNHVVFTGWLLRF